MAIARFSAMVIAVSLLSANAALAQVPKGYWRFGGLWTANQPVSGAGEAGCGFSNTPDDQSGASSSQFVVDAKAAKLFLPDISLTRVNEDGALVEKWTIAGVAIITFNSATTATVAWIPPLAFGVVYDDGGSPHYKTDRDLKAQINDFTAAVDKDGKLYMRFKLTGFDQAPWSNCVIQFNGFFYP